MYDIVISIISFILLILCALYIVKEVIRRKKQRIQNICLEVNWNIGISILGWSIGAIYIIGSTIAQYAHLFNDASVYGYLHLCLLGLSFVLVAFVLAIKKTTLNKETGDMISCSLLGIKRFNIKDITLIKLTWWEVWKVYSNKRKLFVVQDRGNEYPIEFFIRIRETGCEEIHSKGFFGKK